MQQSTAYDIWGVVTGLLCVWLAARESVWNFPVAIVACALAAVVYFRARLYSDVGLQIVFIALGLYGWWLWLRKGPEQGEVHVSRTPGRWWLLLSALALAFTATAGYLFERYTDAAAPYWDNAATAVSLVAQFLLTRKKLENWLLWIGVDVLYVVLYWHRGLALFSVQYVVFLGLAGYGYWQWRRLLRAQDTPSLQPA